MIGSDVVDLDLDGVAPVMVFDEPALVVARRAGVPVGSAVVRGSPALGPDVVGQLVLRDGDPPGPAPGVLGITVAVCTRNRPDLLARCLQSVGVAGAMAAAEIDLEVVVVDNASTDDRTWRAAVDGGARCEYEPVPGLDVARNRAVATSTKSVIAFVDDDVVVDHMWLRTLARALDAHPEAAAVSGQVLALRLDTPARAEFERTSGFSLGWSARSFRTTDADDLPFRPGMGVGCNMALRRSALARIGRFDEALDTGRPLPGGGDIDMMIRAVLDGGVVYEPSAVVFHEHRREWSELRYQFYTWGKGWATVLDKWYRTAPSQRRRIRGVARYTVRSARRPGPWSPPDGALPTLALRAAADRLRRRFARDLWTVGHADGASPPRRIAAPSRVGQEPSPSRVIPRRTRTPTRTAATASPDGPRRTAYRSIQRSNARCWRTMTMTSSTVGDGAVDRVRPHGVRAQRLVGDVHRPAQSDRHERPLVLVHRRSGRHAADRRSADVRYITSDGAGVRSAPLTMRRGNRPRRSSRGANGDTAVGCVGRTPSSGTRHDGPQTMSAAGWSSMRATCRSSFVGGPQVVGVEEAEVPAPGHVETEVARRRQSRVDASRVVDDADPLRLGCGCGVGDGRRTVGRTVVDEHELPVLGLLRAHRLDRAGEEAHLVEEGDDHADQRRVRTMARPPRGTYQ